MDTNIWLSSLWQRAAQESNRNGCDGVCGHGPGCGAAGTVKAGYAYTLGPAGDRLSVVELSGPPLPMVTTISTG